MLKRVISITTLFFAFNAFSTEKSLSLEKIMSDPSWIANSPSSPKWLATSDSIVFSQKTSNSINKLVQLDLANLETLDVQVNALHLADQKQLTFNRSMETAAYIYAGNVFIVNIETNQTTQVTFSSAKENHPQFLNDGTLVFWQNQSAFSYNLGSKILREFVSLQFSDKPAAPEVSDDLIESEQHKLIEFVAKTHNNRVEKFTHKQNITTNNPSIFSQTYYFEPSHRLREVSLSPAGDKLIVVTEKQVDWRNESDIMPNYIGDDGRIHAEKVRRRVADSKPNQQAFWHLDLNTKQVKSIDISTLQDFDKDVLKSVKKENAKSQGKKYKSKKAERTVNLIVDWSWDQSAIQWNSKGDNVSLMLEAWDNKDRWIATVNFEKSKLKQQHQLHDDAWINYTFNNFGWLDSKTLYFLSEQSGYSHIYTKNLDHKKSKRLTSGDYEVSNLVLDQSSNRFYFKANINHPGDYQVYRLPTSSKSKSKPEALTDLKGNNDFWLSPDKTKLLVNHSSLTRPDELFTVDLVEKNLLTKLTDTVSKEFTSYQWQAPKIVAIPSSNQSSPIYSKVYYPKNYSKTEAYKAVVFNHGAGYLQNSHYGWSGYFREFMFHNFLTEQGYVVLDMDYRASKGYGRDWRTAIYRQMGTPEIEDLKDGVDWLVKNVNVDRQKVGTYGGSYGGFMTFMALFNEPDLFQAGAALRPVSDWAHYNDGYTSNILNRPKDDMLAYRKSSPIYFAEGLTKPLLINAPMVDNNVFFVDVVRLVQRLIELEKTDFETAIYPVEPHGFVQPSSWLDEYRRIFKLFETHL